MSAAADPSLEQLLSAWRMDAPRPPGRRDLLVEAALATSFAAVALALVLWPGLDRPLGVADALLLVAAYAIASRIQFPVGAGYTVPTQLVFIPMLLLLPPAVVPALAAAGILAGNSWDYLTRRTHPARALLVLGDAWHAVPPAVVLLAADVGPFEWDAWPIYLAALAVQLSCDTGFSMFREWAARGLDPALQLRLVAWVAAVDAALAPLGLLAAAGAAEVSYAYLLALPLAGLFSLFARERIAHVDAALELSSAYRGTAILLGEVLETRDAYTGGHSRSVVELSLGVAEELGLSPKSRRAIEFAALLHDVGKLEIDDAILNKPGPLDEAEWREIRGHTIAGERMLRQVGGMLGDVGRVVRASHERWDGTGYPDGLVGDEIPIEACVVACCDAFDAMTTTRSYRPALPVDYALDELRANAGAQFSPRVVDALVAVVERERGVRRAARHAARVRFPGNAGSGLQRSQSG